MNRRCVYEREHHRAQDPADYRNGQGFQHGGTGTDAKGERKHACDSGQRSHGDRPEPTAARLNHGLLAGISERTKTLFRVEEKDAVLGNDPNDHDHTHEGSHVKGSAGDQQGEETSEARKQRGGENRRRRGEGAEFEQQHGEQEYERQEKNHQ